MYVIRTKNRDLLGTWLSKNGISTGVHYPLPVHRQPAYRKYRKFVENSLTFTDQWSRTVLSIPMHPNLDPHDQEFIINIITRFYEERLYEQKELHDEEKSWSARLI